MFAFLDPSEVTYRLLFKILKPCATSMFRIIVFKFLDLRLVGVLSF